MAGMTISPGGACCCTPCDPLCSGEMPAKVCFSISGLADRTDISDPYAQCDDCSFVNGRHYAITSLGDCGGGSPVFNCFFCGFNYPLVQEALLCYDGESREPHADARVDLQVVLDSGVYYIEATLEVGYRRRAIYRASLGSSEPTCETAYGDNTLGLIRFESYNGWAWSPYTADSTLNTDCDWAATEVTLYDADDCDEIADRYNCGCEPGTEPSSYTLTLESAFVCNEKMTASPATLDLSGSYLIPQVSGADACDHDCYYTADFSISAFDLGALGTATSLRIYARIDCGAVAVAVSLYFVTSTGAEVLILAVRFLVDANLLNYDQSASNHRLDCGAFSSTTPDWGTAQWGNLAPGAECSRTCRQMLCSDAGLSSEHGVWCTVCSEVTLS